VRRVVGTDFVKVPVPDVIKETPEDVRGTVHEVTVGPEVTWTEPRERSEVV
jgi:hypothetical protein